MKKFKWATTILFVFGMLFTVYLCSGGPNKTVQTPVIKEAVKAKVTVKDGTFTKQALKEELIIQNVKHPEIVYAQAKLETGNFTANIFLVKNNLFAFRGRDGYYTYPSWQESVRVYKLWQDEHYKSGDYYYFLEAIGYAEDSTYIQKVKACVE